MYLRAVGPINETDEVLVTLKKLNYLIKQQIKQIKQ